MDNNDLDNSDDMSEKLDEFRNLALFEGVGLDALEEIVKRSRSKIFQADEVIFEQGASDPSTMYIVKAGELDVLKEMRDKQQQVAKIEAGGSVGEMGILTGKDRMAEISARTSCELIILDKELFKWLKTEQPKDLASIYENIFDDLAKEFKNLADKAEKSQFWL